MIRSALTIGASAFLAAFSTLPAAAQITADEVWADWQRLATETGQTLSATNERRQGGSLVIEGLVTTIDTPDSMVTGTLDRVEMTEQSDGTVAITMSETYPFTVTTRDPEGLEITVPTVVRMPGLEMTASRDGAETLYDYALPEMTVVIEEMLVDGDAQPMSLDLSVSTLEGTYMFDESDSGDGDPLLRTTQTIGAMAMALDIADPAGEDGDVSIVLTASDIDSNSTSTLAAVRAFASGRSLTGPGLRSEGEVSFGPIRYEISGEADGSAFAMAANAARGVLDFAIDEGALSYGGTNSEVDFALSGSEIPFPQVSFSLAESTWNLTMPVGPTDTPQDLGLLLGLRGLTIDDALWAVIDPQGALPRDPATLILDLAGRGNWLVDFTDPSLEPEDFENGPGEIEALTVNELRLEAVGTELTGSGDFTFDNSGTAPFAGMPSPEGALDLRLVGANGLIDQLIAMGLLPEDQAMGTRMMLGMFARPGDGDDTLVSRIEFGADGSISANGMQIR